jgi:hypothetical protein
MSKSGRAKAFELFSQGYYYTDPKVKQLGLSGSTRRNYFQSWKSLGKPSKLTRTENNAKPSAKLPDGETIANVNENIVIPEPEENESEEGFYTEKEDKIFEDEDDNIPDVSSEGDLVEIKDEEIDLGPDHAGNKVAVGEKIEVPSDGKRKTFPSILSQGLQVTVNLSVKTLMLYQMAASMQEEELVLGDFLDACVEDTYQGRGKDLGLIDLGGCNA